MIVIDSSAWIEYLRATGSAANREVRRAIEGDVVVVPELVRMELLIGRDAVRTRRLLDRFEVSPLAPLDDSERAARIYRRCAGAGARVRNMIDCLIAATALRLGLPILHQDRDFEIMAELVGLETISTLD